MPSLRVVHLAGYGGSYPGSFIPMLESARRAVEQRGWSYEAGFPAGSERHPWLEDLRQRGVLVHVAPEQGLIGWTRRLADGPDPLLIHAHFSTFDLAVLLAARSHRPSAVIWHLHSPLRHGARVNVTNRLRFGLGGRLVDRILCVGPEIQAAAEARWAPPGRVELFPNGIDTELRPPISAAERADARATLGLSDDAQVLVHFGWDWIRKGGPLLIAALARLLDEGRPVIALVVGSEIAATEAAAGGCASAVRSLPPQPDPRSLYAAADVFVAPSSAEGMPFAVLEALCVGCPVVASDIESHRFIAEGLPALRLAAQHPEDIASAVARELDSPPEQRLARLRESRATIEARHSLRGWSESLMKVYDSVLGA